MLTADDVIDSFWQAADELPKGAIAEPALLRLLAGLCDELDRVEPSERFSEEARECREAADVLGPLSSGESVRLAYVYSAMGDGFVELQTFDAEDLEHCESGTVVGTPGAQVRFDSAEAHRAVEILRGMFAGGGAAGGAEPGDEPN